MKSLFLLIMLSQNGAGDVNVSFVNTQTLEQCQQKALMVEAVFAASNIPIIESRCIKSNLQFSDFGHASSSSLINNFYLISLDEKNLTISKQSDWRSCMENQNSDIKQTKVYCSSSIQSLK